jgi:alpha-1,6-mannosyl-glycoprotein beta-1,2-N-acetylglucosaminyltransferase
LSFTLANFPLIKKSLSVFQTYSARWISTKYNMGMAFNRTTWRDIKSCNESFCSLDDYNWDWTLQFISENCMKNKMNVVVADGPRVFHIGEW